VREGAVAFADNLYHGPSPLPPLRDASPGNVTVLASSYQPALAPSRGILITTPGQGQGPRHVERLVEKPDPAQARKLEEQHGPGSLLMLEGRALLTMGFIEFARTFQRPAAGSSPWQASIISGRHHQTRKPATLHAPHLLRSKPRPASDSLAVQTEDRH
jgi:hypothetical protein